MTSTSDLHTMDCIGGQSGACFFAFLFIENEFRLSIDPSKMSKIVIFGYQSIHPFSRISTDFSDQSINWKCDNWSIDFPHQIYAYKNGKLEFSVMSSINRKHRKSRFFAINRSIEKKSMNRKGKNYVCWLLRATFFFTWPEKNSLDPVGPRPTKWKMFVFFTWSQTV